MLMTQQDYSNLSKIIDERIKKLVKPLEEKIASLEQAKKTVRTTKANSGNITENKG